MADRLPRWEQDAARVRARGPAWLDMDRWPWWAWAAFAAWWTFVGIKTLVAAGGLWDVIGGLGLLLLLGGGSARTAVCRSRGLPLP